MKKRLYKKALKWFISNRFCLIDPIPTIKGKYKLTLWSRWKEFNLQSIRYWNNVQPYWNNVQPLIEELDTKIKN